MKRYPRLSAKYGAGQLKFENDCAYRHIEPATNKEHLEMTEKLKQLDKAVHALIRKVLGLEEEMSEMKKNHLARKAVKA